MADFCKMLNHAIKDEGKGSKFYTKLRRATRCNAVKGIITAIQTQEKNHARVLRDIRDDVCR